MAAGTEKLKSPSPSPQDVWHLSTTLSHSDFSVLPFLGITSDKHFPCTPSLFVSACAATATGTRPAVAA